RAPADASAGAADAHPGVGPFPPRTKPLDRLLLISDALSMAGMGDGRVTISGQEVEIRDGKCVLADGSGTLAGAVIALDTAVRNVTGSGASLPATVAAASRNPLAMLGVSDRGRLAVG